MSVWVLRAPAPGATLELAPGATLEHATYGDRWQVTGIEHNPAAGIGQYRVSLERPDGSGGRHAWQVDLNLVAEFVEAGTYRLEPIPGGWLPAPVRFVDETGAGRPDVYMVARRAPAGTPERWRLYESRTGSPAGEWVGAADYFRLMVRRLIRAGYSIAPEYELIPCMVCGDYALDGYPCLNPECNLNDN